jgi:hypothetical protein
MKSFRKFLEDVELTDAYGETFAVIHDVVKVEPLKRAKFPNAPFREDDVNEVEEGFKTQYGKKDKMAQSSERKTLGRRSSTKDGSKPTGYESPKEFRDKSMPLRKFRDRFQREGIVTGALAGAALVGGVASIMNNARKAASKDNHSDKSVGKPTLQGVASGIRNRNAALQKAMNNSFDPISAGVATYLEGASWTKKSGKNQEGGLNEKGRKSYEKANPGSDLKAPTKTKGNPRRSSFCARMKGMKKKLTSKKTASDPDSRINKSLRKWDC